MTSDHPIASELARLCALKNVKHAVISPGSRSAPLVNAFHHDPDIACHVVIDERSAGFFALGIAMRTNSAVALICTSGSALLNYGPAVAEAYYQHIPLLILSADRPQEWIDQGEGQTIRQLGAFGHLLRGTFQMPRTVMDPLHAWYATRSINEALNLAIGPVPGPVHVNIPFNEPLYGSREVPPDPPKRIMRTEPVMTLDPTLLRELAEEFLRCDKVMIMVGQGHWSAEDGARFSALADLPQVVVLTEATSNLTDPAFVLCIDRVLALIQDDDAQFSPDLLVTFGGAVVSKRIKERLRRWRPKHHWHVSAMDRNLDTYQCLTRDIPLAAGPFLRDLLESTKAGSSEYRAEWHALGERARERHEDFLKRVPFSDLAVFRAIMDRIPDGSDVHLANSTPARYAQLFERRKGLRFYSNRGTSGIEGCTSTALGAAFVSGTPTTLITGDVAFCYDSNAFWNGHRPKDLKVIVIDNGGGNIFRIIPGPSENSELLPYFESPHGRDPLKLAKGFGLASYEANDSKSLGEGLNALYSEQDGPAVLVVRTAGETSPKVLRDHFAFLATEERSQ